MIDTVQLEQIINGITPSPLAWDEYAERVGRGYDAQLVQMAPTLAREVLDVLRRVPDLEAAIMLAVAELTLLLEEDEDEDQQANEWTGDIHEVIRALKNAVGWE